MLAGFTWTKAKGLTQQSVSGRTAGRVDMYDIDDNGLVVNDDRPTRFKRIIKRGRQFEMGVPGD